MDDKTEMTQPKMIGNPLTSIHAGLRDQLTSGTLRPNDFLDKLFELDQQHKDLQTCESNLQLLEDPQVRALIENPNNPQLQHTFLDRLSFFRYHQAQFRATSGDIRAAMTFDRAVEEKLRARSYLSELLTKQETGDEVKTFIHGIIDEKTGDSLFTLYMQANAAYMRRRADDIKGFFVQLSKLDPEGINTKIVGNLLHAVEQNKTPDYKADHHP